MSRPAAVIVLAAGQGTRMKSALPKVVHPLAGLSMIGHALRAAHGLDPEHLVAVVRHQREVVAAEIARVSPAAIIADQDETSRHRTARPVRPRGSRPPQSPPRLAQLSSPTAMFLSCRRTPWPSWSPPMRARGTPSLS